jgi:CHAD domain-containing protein
MQQNLLELTEIIDHAGTWLVQEYDVRQLHMLRVTTRRIRSILKQVGSFRSRHFRKTWGGFAAVTSSARDWDVFLITAEALLPPEEYQAFETINQKRIQLSHEAVSEMVRSAHWQLHMEEWSAYLEHSDYIELGGGQQLAALDQALTRATIVLATALTLEDDRSWHKFRIAVKAVRYVADTGMDDPEKAEYLTGVIDSCKSLQAVLGDWHDTVVQLDLLDELDATPVHSRLIETIRQRKQLFLSQLHQLLGEQTLFQPEAPASL